MLDPRQPSQSARRAAALAWNLDEPSERDVLHRLIALLADADCAVAERFLRHLVLTSYADPGALVSLVIGPQTQGVLARFADEVERIGRLGVRHRLIRSDFCRIDGYSEDPEHLCADLAALPGVADVRRVDDTIYVLAYPPDTGSL